MIPRTLPPAPQVLNLSLSHLSAERFCASPGSSPNRNGGSRENSGRKSLDLTPEEKKARAKELVKNTAKVSVTKELKKRCLDMLQGDDPTVAALQCWRIPRFE